MRFLAIVLLLAGFSFGAENWSGAFDTTWIRDTLGNGEVSYGAADELSDGENARVVVLVNDTSSAGFASDSVNVRWGFQTGMIVFNASGSRDTAWDERVVVDTLVTASFGSSSVAVHGSDGIITRTWSKRADTTYVSGFAYQSRLVVPEWDVVVRLWFEGITGNKQGKPLRLGGVIGRREYTQVRLK
jgi:hypothetical protein